MIHERQAIREELVKRLKGTAPAWPTVAQDRVFKSRHKPARTQQLPMISVMSEDEETDSDSGPNRLERTYRVTVVGWVVSSSDVDDRLDDLALQIERTLDADPYLDANVMNMRLVATAIDESLEGERPIGAVALTFECTYETHPRVDAPTDEFDTAASTFDLGGAQAPDDRSSTFVTGINQEP